MDVVFDLVKHIVSTKYEDIPEVAVTAAKTEIVDSLATALGGTTKPGVGELVDMAKELGGTPQSTIIGYGIKVPADNAAQVNGSMIHALDYDDGHPVSLVHVGCVAISTAFAVAERMGNVTGKELLAAIALGQDFDSRMGLASRPGSTALGAGWHPTTLFGYITAAVIASKVMRLDEEGMINAIGLAYHQCGGAATGVGDGALAKRMGPGFAAKAGVTAALMAERGITGERSSLEGRDGFGGLYNVYIKGDYDPKILTNGLGEKYLGVEIGDKPYPCCGFGHPFYDAALSLREKHNINVDDIKEITAIGGQSGYGLCRPLEIKQAPRTIVDAQFSVPYGVAVALVRGTITLEDYTAETIKRENILEVARKVSGVLEDSWTKHGVSPGKLVITMNDGTEYSEYVEDFLGSVGNPMSYDDCAKKFRECAPFALNPLPSEKIEEIIDLIRNLEKQDDGTLPIQLTG
ncbi:MAG: MmgE/PrpD family protein [Dehalococcoidales bacterium]|nr:MmgE/PrpD family protein [Dehalococcoidales bacterium]